MTDAPGSLEEPLRRSLHHVQQRKKEQQGMSEQQQGIVRVDASSGALDFSSEQVRLLREGYAPGASDVEFRMLLEVAAARRLNPFLKQIHFVKRKSKDDNGNWRESWTSQVSIDGLRAIAQRTGLYDGQDEPEFELNKDGLIVAARVKVYRKDWSRPSVGCARWDEYVQTTRDGSPTKFWANMPHVMIAKCAEALALRKAFPEDMSGLVTDEEMMQADSQGGLRKAKFGTPPQEAPALSLSPHSDSRGEGGDLLDLPEYTAVMGRFEAAKADVFDPLCSWDTMNRWRQEIGTKAAPAALSKRLSELYKSDQVGEQQKKALGAIWNSVDRKLTQLEGKLKPPPVEASFTDEPDGTEALAPGREPGADEDEDLL